MRERKGDVLGRETRENSQPDSQTDARVAKERKRENERKKKKGGKENDDERPRESPLYFALALIFLSLALTLKTFFLFSTGK